MGKLASKNTLFRQKIFDALKQMNDTKSSVFITLHDSRLKIRSVTDDDYPQDGLKILFYLQPKTRFHFGNSNSNGKLPIRIQDNQYYRNGKKRPNCNIPMENIVAIIEEEYER